MRLVLTLFFLVQVSWAFAQAGSIRGRVVDENNEPVIGATVRLQDTGYGAATNVNGQYAIVNVKVGQYKLIVSAIGFASKEYSITVTAAAAATLNASLAESTQQLNAITVTAQADATLMARQPITVSSINTAQIKGLSTDAAFLLDRVSGVRVQQAGGMGSTAQINLNGLTGNAVRVYYDGVPITALGGVFNVNNLPVNAVERIDVYKGVMPVEVGTDALAGGVNIVPSKVVGNYVDASYELGSFNTHRFTLNTYKLMNSGFFIGFNGFYNYSDNNYKMQVTNNVYNENTIVGQEEITVRRFHSAHQSYYTEMHLGVQNQSWADDLSYKVAFSSREDEIQHGARIDVIPVGQATQAFTGVVQYLNYEKTGLFNSKLDLKYNGFLGLINEHTQDSTTRIYDWYGNVAPIERSRGSEVLLRPTLRDIDQVSTVQRFNATYHVGVNHRLTLNHFYSYLRLEGTDVYGPTIAGIDPNTVPSTLEKNITGASFSSTWFNGNFESIVFGKRYQYAAKAIDLFQVGASTLPLRAFADQSWGYGLGLKWQALPSLFVRGSFERATRIPEQFEIFGNFTSSRPNYFITPETSNNLNLGLTYNGTVGNQTGVKAELNGFLRNQSDLIFLAVNNISLGQYRNQAEARARGIEASLRLEPSPALQLEANLTRQEIVALPTGTEQTNTPIPNRPTFFFNASGRYTIADFTGVGRALTMGWYFNFIEEFSFIQEGAVRNDDNWIPRQILNDFDISYMLKDQGLTFSLSVNNVLNQEVFDLYSIPRPGRNFRFKIRYLFTE